MKNIYRVLYYLFIYFYLTTVKNRTYEGFNWNVHGNSFILFGLWYSFGLGFCYFHRAQPHKFFFYHQGLLFFPLSFENDTNFLLILSDTGVNLALLSRVMSSRLSRGTYNGGLLSTEAGTIARVIADGTITLAGYLGRSRLLNVTLIPSLLICVVSIVSTCYTYNSLYWW